MEADPTVESVVRRGLSPVWQSRMTPVRSEKSMTAQLEQPPETEGQSMRLKVNLRLEGSLPAEGRWAGDHQGEDWG